MCNGPNAEAAVLALIRTARVADDESRVAAIETLGKIGSRSPHAIPALTNALADNFQPVRAKAVRMLGKLGPVAKDTVPSLILAWKTEQDESVKLGILDALGLIGPEAKAAVPTLVDALHNKSSIIRWCAARTLGRIEPAAAGAIPAIEE